MMTWSIESDVGEIAWTPDGLFDDSAGGSFSEWARTAGTVSASPTGPELAVDLTDEVAAWWAAQAWMAKTDATIIRQAPPAGPEPWMADPPADAIY